VQCCVCCRSLSFSCWGDNLGPAAVAAERDITEPAVLLPLLLLLLPGSGNW
jgi:hypothetical protein